MKNKRELHGYCAYNKGNPQLDNMSFDTNKARITRHWGKTQEIKKCILIIHD